MPALFELIPPTVALTKQDQPDGNATVDEPGGDVRYTITMTNTSLEPVTITHLTDTTTYENPAQETAYNLLTPALPISEVQCSAKLSEAIDPHETVACTFVVALAGNAQIVSDRVDVLVTDDDAQIGGDVAEAQVPILDVRPEISVAKTADPVVVSPGDEVTYTLVITNLSTVEPVTLLTIVDDRFGDVLPECDQFGTARTLASGASTTCEFERVLDEPPDSTHTNVVTVSAADDETLVNLAAARQFQDSSVLPVTATSEAAVVTVGPDLALTKGDAGFVGTTGQQMPFAYTLTVVNVGEGGVNAADTATVVDDLPDAFEWVAPAPAGCTINGQQLTCAIPAASLRPAGTAVTIVATAQVKPGAGAGVYENLAYVTTPDDPVCVPNEIEQTCVPPSCADAEAVAANNNVDCEPTEVVPASADLAIVMHASLTQVGGGGAFNWLIDVTNNGPTQATTIVIGDVVPGQVEVVGVTSARFTCNRSGNSVSCTTPTMAAGETGQITIAVTVPASAVSGVVNNVASVSATTPDPTPANNSSAASVTVFAQVPPTTTPPNALPPTGSDSTLPFVLAAFGLIVSGGLAFLLGGRRRTDD